MNQHQDVSTEPQIYMEIRFCLDDKQIENDGGNIKWHMPNKYEVLEASHRPTSNILGCVNLPLLSFLLSSDRENKKNIK